MSGDDWQPGDLALCIKVGAWSEMQRRPLVDGGPSAGKTYRVSDVVSEEGPCLYFGNPWPFDIFQADRFRKIRPHTPDVEDEETIRLLTGKPEPVA